MVKFQLLKPRAGLRRPRPGGRQLRRTERHAASVSLSRPRADQGPPRRPRPPAPVQPARAGDRRRRRGGDGVDALPPAEGHLPEEIDLEAFFASLEDQNLVGRDSEGGLQLTTGGERRIRRSAFEEIFSTLGKLGPGLPPHPRLRRGDRAPPRDAPLQLRRRHPPPRLVALAPERLQADIRGERGRRLQPGRGGPGGLRDRAPDLLRHGGGDRHQPLDDPLRRGPHHAGEDRGAGADRADHHQVPEGPPLGDPLRRPGRAGLPLGDPLHPGRARSTPTPATRCSSRAASSPGRSSRTSRSS